MIPISKINIPQEIWINEASASRQERRLKDKALKWYSQRGWKAQRPLIPGSNTIPLSKLQAPDPSALRSLEALSAPAPELATVTTKTSNKSNPLNDTIMKNNKIPFLTKFEAWLSEGTLLKGLILLAVVMFLWIAGAELLNHLDPRFSAEDTETTFLGDWILVAFTISGFAFLVWWLSKRAKK